MVTAKDAKPGKYIFIDGEPCRILSLQKSKTGRHGSTKVRIEATGLIDGKKRVILKPGVSTLKVPVIKKSTAQVISVSGEIVQLMDMTDYSTFEASIPEDLKGRLDSGVEIAYWKIGEKIILKDVKK